MSNTLTAQLLGVAVTLCFVVVIVRMVRRRKLRAKYSFLWLLVSLVTLPIAMVPGLLDTFARAAGIFYPPAFLFICAIVFLLFIAVHFSWELSRLEDRVRTLAEELGLANEMIARLEAGHADQDVDEARLLASSRTDS